ncbi:MAG TPA: single-stranded DNA-binding protein, partial [Bryobacteraceae bacterium]|nr:single-stranded DNA-binding protein [Bryobacteraceae bacterium]
VFRHGQDPRPTAATGGHCHSSRRAGIAPTELCARRSPWWKTNWLQKEHASSLIHRRRIGLFHVTYAFGRTAEYAATLTKGAHVQIVGEIQTRSFVGRDGAKKSVTEIRVHRVARLDRTSKTESPEEAAA